MALQSVSAFAADPEPSSANMVSASFAPEASSEDMPTMASASFAPEASSEDMEWVICKNGWCPDGFSCKRSGEECMARGWHCAQHYECLSAVCLPGMEVTGEYIPRVCL